MASVTHSRLDVSKVTSLMRHKRERGQADGDMTLSFKHKTSKLPHRAVPETESREWRMVFFVVVQRRDSKTFASPN